MLHRMETAAAPLSTRLAIAGGLILLCLSGTEGAKGEEIAREKALEHPRILGAGECTECHRSEVKAWQETEHYRSRDLHQDPKAREIAEKLGISPVSRVRSSALCTQCHFTVQKLPDHPAKAIGGISCESCHGGALKWIDLHNTGDRRKPGDTSAEHQKRRAESVAAGMCAPEAIDQLAAKCFQCHIVTDETLVNVGGHPAGSEFFEMVSWLKGEVRHNFFESKGKTNAPIAPERRRLMFLVGKVVEMEYSLRGLARAEDKADYGKAMGRRCVTTRESIDEIVATLGEAAPEPLKDIQAAISEPGLLRFFNVGPLTRAADLVEEKAALLVEEHDGRDLSALDSLIPAEGEGKPFQP